MNNENKIISPFKCLCVTIGNLPTAYIESMSYYEALTYMMKYIERTIIPSVNGNTEAIGELQTAYITLKDYVDNYFENLDVQTEINNKLDEMAESGELSEIIAQYLQLGSVLSFDTVSAMKLSENLVDGSICKTIGYYAVNDGGGATYKIRDITNADTIDESFLIALSDPNLVAELIYNSPINVLTLGVKNDGSSDISDIVNSATTVGSLFFPEGRYLVADEITLYHSIFGENYTRAVNDSTYGSIFVSDISCNYDLAGNKTVFDISNVDKGFEMKSISILLNEYESGIKYDGSQTYIYLDKISIENIKSTGIYLNSTSSRAFYLNNITLYGTKYTYENSRGLYVNSPDNKAENLEIMGCRIGAEFGGYIMGSNFHIWCGALQGHDGVLNHTDSESWFKGTKALITNECNLDVVYLDTAYQKLVGGGNNNRNAQTISNLKTFDDNSMEDVSNLNGENFHNWNGSISNHTNHITYINKNHCFNTNIKYKNENVILNIPENTYFGLSEIGSNRYYEIEYSIVKDLTESNNILEIGKIKIPSGCSGIVDLYVIHANLNSFIIRLVFDNGSYVSGSAINNGRSNEKIYISTSKDGDNIYKLYIKSESYGTEYVSLNCRYLGNNNRVNVVDLGYRNGDNTVYDPEVLSSTSSLTEITQA